MFVLRDQASWSAFVAQSSKTDWPKVDFASNMVLVVGKVTHYLGRIRIGQLLPQGNSLVARYADCSGNGMAVSFGCHVVKVPRDDRQIVFEGASHGTGGEFCSCD